MTNLVVLPHQTCAPTILLVLTGAQVDSQSRADLGVRGQQKLVRAACVRCTELSVNYYH